MANLVVIVNACFECDTKFVQPQKLQNYLKNQHLITIPERTKCRRHNNHNFTYVKTSALHDSIEEQFGCPACLQHYARKHELKIHYYSSHPETIPAMQHQRQRLTGISDDTMADRQETTSTGDDSEAGQQESVISDDDTSTTEQPEENGKQNKRHISCNDSVENELLNPTCIFFHL
ncbi:hypothetical protein G6F46_003979 [Rhizopus delemar]|nr:hypothetical protein G6F36_011487 [Rhizopus arrhizus]KAG1496774.1 hypothetical protein G6F54_006239 [Rhizopus delemar]KAG1518448.1 hypothetical protein G6F53_000587 [Rhizopus delemar]KAG1591617.1 hypothetical protein G6F48_003185 [Rhizopus delemar]KAG1604922.1 hypothetical protein G6F47_000499 [Rhizopus delemar]